MTPPPDLAESEMKATPRRWKVDAFADKMESELRKNDHKSPWSDESIYWLGERLDEEVKELHEAIVDPKSTWEKVVSEAADVANFCMMIADNAGGLERPSDDDLTASASRERQLQERVEEAEQSALELKRSVNDGIDICHDLSVRREALSELMREATTRLAQYIGMCACPGMPCVTACSECDKRQGMVNRFRAALLPASAETGASPCIVCGKPVPDIGPKNSMPPRDGWAHPDCATSAETKESDHG